MSLGQLEVKPAAVIADVSEHRQAQWIFQRSGVNTSWKCLEFVIIDARR